MEYQVSLTPQAMEQLGQAASYIQHTLQAPQTAKRWLDLLQREIAALHFMPSRFPLTGEEPWHSNGIRRMPVHHFLVYYLVDEARRTVTVTAVIYGRRDQLAALGDMTQNQ